MTKIMKAKLFMLFILALFLDSCASTKLSKTMWHNITISTSEGVMTTIGTSMYFNSDSTVVLYKSASLDTIVLYEPFLYAQGNYELAKDKKGQTNIRLNTKKSDGSPYVFEGTYNKRTGLMILNQPDSKKKFTYVLDKKIVKKK